jgi:hypothetical protein
VVGIAFGKESVFQGLALELPKGACELVGTACGAGAAAYAVDAADYVVDALAAHQLAYPLEIAVASAKEKHLLYHVVLVGGHVDKL